MSISTSLFSWKPFDVKRIITASLRQGRPRPFPSKIYDWMKPPHGPHGRRQKLFLQNTAKLDQRNFNFACAHSLDLAKKQQTLFKNPKSQNRSDELLDFCLCERCASLVFERNNLSETHFPLYRNGQCALSHMSKLIRLQVLP